MCFLYWDRTFQPMCYICMYHVQNVYKFIHQKKKIPQEIQDIPHIFGVRSHSMARAKKWGRIREALQKKLNQKKTKHKHTRIQFVLGESVRLYVSVSPNLEGERFRIASLCNYILVRLYSTVHSGPARSDPIRPDRFLFNYFGL